MAPMQFVGAIIYAGCNGFCAVQSGMLLSAANDCGAGFGPGLRLWLIEER
jgi:hypothetical protein